jgi:peptide-methionine (S)-S-oxide reductase
VVRTRVGYSGGKSTNPTYHNLNGHSETVQLDFDSGRISYQRLLNIFWHNHSPDNRPWSRQYMSIIFYHNEEQRKAAEETKTLLQKDTKIGTIYTEIIPYQAFYLAEDYHQKYWLQNSPDFMQEFKRMYPDFKDIVNSTACARVNGILGGYGLFDGIKEELGSLGLSATANKRLMEIVKAHERELTASKR